MNLRGIVQRSGRARLRRPARVTRGAARKPRALCWSSPGVTYLICTNPRSGSWLLSEGLSATGVAGNPREWFNIAEEQRLRAQWRMDHPKDLRFAHYFALANAGSTTSNGVSGVKLHYYQLTDLARKVAVVERVPELSGEQLLAKCFPDARLLWLTRRDKERQAVSAQIASATRQWWEIEGVANPRAGDSSEPEFDPRAIARAEANFLDDDAQWQSLFRATGRSPFVVYYEDFAADYAGTIRSILEWLGVTDAGAVTIAAPRLRRQADARNEQWLAAYRLFKSEHSLIMQAQATPANQTQAFDSIPDPWKQWVAHSKLLKTGDEAIVEVLTSNGYSRQAAAAEAARANSDPYLRAATQAYQRRSKGAALLNALGRMARLDSRARLIERRRALSRDEFRDRYYAANRPVILQGLMTDWKALQDWSPEMLKSAGGDQTIDVRGSWGADASQRAAGGPSRSQMLFRDYVDMAYGAKGPDTLCMLPSNAVLQAPGLAAGFSGFPEYLNPAMQTQDSFLSLDPADVALRLAQAPRNVLLAQVFGRRRYRLVPATQWQYLHNRAGTVGDADPERPDRARTPKFNSAIVKDTVVAPGEVLFLPVGWWRHVRTLDVDLTVSFANFIFPNLFTWE